MMNVDEYRALIKNGRFVHWQSKNKTKTKKPGETYFGDKKNIIQIEKEASLTT